MIGLAKQESRGPGGGARDDGLRRVPRNRQMFRAGAGVARRELCPRTGPYLRRNRRKWRRKIDADEDPRGLRNGQRGELRINGQAMQFTGSRAAEAEGIVMIHQEFNQPRRGPEHCADQDAHGRQQPPDSGECVLFAKVHV
jgi:hypothetical protein